MYTVAWWILVSKTGIEPMPSAVEMQSLNHWTAREVSHLSFTKNNFFYVTILHDYNLKKFITVFIAVLLYNKLYYYYSAQTTTQLHTSHMLVK